MCIRDRSSSVSCGNRKPQQQFSTSRSNGNVQGNNQKSPQNRRRFIRPFDDNVNEPRQTPTETNQSISGPSIPSGRDTAPQSLARAGSSGVGNVQRPPGVPPGVCWVCRQPRCHSRFHEVERPPSPQPRVRTPDVCWTCGQQGCRSWFHSTPRPATPVPLMEQNPENMPGTPRSGNRGPTKMARRA